MAGLGALLDIIGGKVLEKGPGVGQAVSRGGLAAFDVMRENPELIPNIEKLRAGEEPDLFTHIFGIPTPFMQLGTYLGMEGWSGLAVDLIADPMNFLGGMGTIMEKVGRGGRIARGMVGAGKASKAKQAAIGITEHLAETAKGLRGPEAIAEVAARRTNLEEQLFDIDERLSEIVRDEGGYINETVRKHEIARIEGSLKAQRLRLEKELRELGDPRFQGGLSAAELEAEALFHAPQAASVLQEIAYKNASAAHKTNSLLALVRRSAQLDTHGHQQLLDLLQLAGNDQEGLEIIKQLQAMRSKMESVEGLAPAYGRTKVWQPGKRQTFAPFEHKLEDAAIRQQPAGFKIESRFVTGTTRTINPILQHLPGKVELEGIRASILSGAQKGLASLEKAKLGELGAVVTKENQGLEAGKLLLQEMIDKRKDLGALARSFGEAGAVKEALEIAKQMDQLEPNQQFRTIFGPEGRKLWKSYFQQAGGTLAGPAIKAPKEGYTRLWRAEYGGPKTSPAPWIQQGLEEAGATQASGRWFTEDLGALPWYERNVGEGAVRKYVDVPTADLEKYRVSNVTEKIKGRTPASFSKDPNKEFFVSPELARSAKAPKLREVPALARGFEAQVAAKQRNLLTIGIPFLPNTERVIATGAPILQAFAKGINVVKATKVAQGLKAPKYGPYAGATAKAVQRVGERLGSFDQIGSYDTIQDFTNQLIHSFAGGGLGTPENADSMLLQHAAMNDHAATLAAATGADIRSAVNGKDDLYRLAMENKDNKYFKTLTMDGGGLMEDTRANGFWGQPTYFTRKNLKPEFQDAFTDIDLANLQAISQRHIHFNNLLESMGMLQEAIEGYIPRLVKKVNHPEKFEAFLHAIPARMTRGKSHFKQRTVPFYEDLMELERQGVLELEHDFGKVEAHWANQVIQTAGRKRLYERLRNARVPVDGTDQVIPLAVKRTSKTFDKYPKLYAATQDPHVIRAFSTNTGNLPNELMVLEKHLPHLQLALGGRSLTALAGTPREQRFLDAMLKVNTVTKRAVMGSDAVNYGWFTERAAGTLGRRWLQDPIAQTRMGAYHRMRATDMWDLAYKSGLKGNPIEQDLDTYLHMLDTAANWAEKVPVAGKLVGQGIRNFRKFSAGIEQPAWQYFQPSLKMQAFAELHERALFDPRFAKLPASEIAQGVAAHVNSAFSGLNWERMWVGEAGQKWLRLLFVAPDWMSSTIKLGADLFANQTARLPFLGRDMVAPAVRAAYARDYALRAGIFTFGFLELVNLATSSDPMHFLKTGQLNGHYMHNNEPGHEAQLQLPIGEDGKPLFWLPHKQWQDFNQAANVFGSGDPFRFIANRMGLVPSLFETVVHGRDSFGYPIVSTKDGFVGKFASRMGWLGSSALLPSYAQTMIGVGSASARPIRGALEMGLSIRTGQKQSRFSEDVEAPKEVINLEQEPVPEPDPIPPEFEQALEQEIQENPTYVKALNEHLRRMNEANTQGLFDDVRRRRMMR